MTDYDMWKFIKSHDKNVQEYMKNTIEGNIWFLLSYLNKIDNEPLEIAPPFSVRKALSIKESNYSVILRNILERWMTKNNYSIYIWHQLSYNNKISYEYDQLNKTKELYTGEFPSDIIGKKNITDKCIDIVCFGTHFELVKSYSPILCQN